MAEPTLLLPTFLPGGESLLQDHDFVKRLHEGDASIGWLGDERLGVYFADDRIELWRHCEDGEMRLILRSRAGHRTLNTDTLRVLAAHDSRRRGGFDAVAETNRHNDALRARADDRHADQTGEFADRLHFALRKDMGAYEGGSTKRLQPLPAAPWVNKNKGGSK